MEDRFLQTIEALWKLLALLTPMTMRLLWLRQTAQLAPDTPATAVVSEEIVRLVALLDKRPGVALTAKQLWHTIARFGDYLDRKSDPPPGWQTLWQGWMDIQTVLEGVLLAPFFLLPDLCISVRLRHRITSPPPCLPSSDRWCHFPTRVRGEDTERPAPRPFPSADILQRRSQSVPAHRTRQ